MNYYIKNILLCGFLLQGCYELREGFYYIKLTGGTKLSLDEAIISSHLTSIQKQKLMLIKDSLNFAYKENLNICNAYDTYIDLGYKKDLSYMLIVAQRFDLKLKEWCFLLFGCFPYLGFFYNDDMEKAAQQLQKQYDVFQTKTAGFSTLGLLKDYIYSTMLNQKDVHLIRVIFHELIHKNFWIKNNVSFNEFVAEYFSIFLTKKFLQTKSKIQELENFEKYLLQKKEFQQWLNKLLEDLKILYDKFKNEENMLSIEQKISQKQEIFDAHVKKSKHLSFATSNFISSVQWNNASVLSFKIYEHDMSLLDKFQECFNFMSVGVFLKKLKTKIYTFSQDPWILLNTIAVTDLCH